MQPDELSIQILPDRINKNILTCALCNTLITDLFQAFENGTSNEVIAQSIADRCESLVVLNAEVCGGFATLALVILFCAHRIVMLTHFCISFIFVLADYSLHLQQLTIYFGQYMWDASSR